MPHHTISSLTQLLAPSQVLVFFSEVRITLCPDFLNPERELLSFQDRERITITHERHLQSQQRAPNLYNHEARQTPSLTQSLGKGLRCSAFDCSSRKQLHLRIFLGADNISKWPDRPSGRIAPGYNAAFLVMMEPQKRLLKFHHHKASYNKKRAYGFK